MGDHGTLGPASESWPVLAERTVVLGGTRALLMQAAHPLVAAAGEQTGMYERDPWGRLDRTLRLTFTLVFGTPREARASARRINATHREVRGAADPELLLWVQATLTSSFLLFERLTVGRLDDAGRQRFHDESMRVAGLLGLPAHRAPPSVAALGAYVDEVCAGGVLRMTGGARAVARLLSPEQSAGAASRAARLLAFHTLPPAVRRVYGVKQSPAHRLAVSALGAAIRGVRPLIPRRRRLIGPALAAYARTRGENASVPSAPVLPPRRRRP